MNRILRNSDEANPVKVRFFAQAEKKPPEKVQKTLGTLYESAKNAFHLMGNLLHRSRSRLNRITPAITELSLAKLVHESSRMFETIIKQKNIQFVIQLPDHEFIKADEDLFMCVVRIISPLISHTLLICFSVARWNTHITIFLWSKTFSWVFHV